MITLPPFAQNFLASPKLRKQAGIWAGAALVLIALGVIYWQLETRHRAVAVQLDRKLADVKIAREHGLSQMTPQELVELQKDAAVFREGFIRVADVPVVLNGISEEASRHDVEVTSINSLDPVGVSAAGGEAVTIDGSSVQRLPINLIVRARTSDLGDFLSSLSLSSKRLFVVDSMDIKMIDAKSREVECTMTLSYFSKG